VLLRSGTFVLFLLSVGLIQSSHAAYNTYGAIHWQKEGLSKAAIGWLFAEGVLAEIVLFRLARLVWLRVPALWLIGLGALGGTLRWCALATTSSLPVLIAVQWLHALSFGCTHLGALQWIQQRVSPERSTTAQGLAAAVASGVCSAAATGLASVWYPADGGSVFFGMAGIATLGGAGALLLARRCRHGLADVAAA
jgi:PPP family 3-phenylpropionic acid transporter